MLFIQYCSILLSTNNHNYILYRAYKHVIYRVNDNKKSVSKNVITINETFKQ